jgi:hypothetical protein
MIAGRSNAQALRSPTVFMIRGVIRRWEEIVNAQLNREIKLYVKAEPFAWRVTLESR